MVSLTEQIIRGKTRLERLEDVKNLNLWGQDLEDVSILSKLVNVEVLSLSVNRINTLRDFRHCLKLGELYLRKNDISDVAEIQYLMPLENLKVLWLVDNPCSDHPYYRQLVAKALPSVEKLDNQEFTPQERELARRNPELDKYLTFPPLPVERLPRSSPPPPSAPGPGLGGGYSPVAAQGRSGSPGRSRYSDLSLLPGVVGVPGKNALYAIMALVPLLDEEDLIYVKRELETRLGPGHGF